MAFKVNQMILSSQQELTIIEKLKALPPERVAEVEDFVDFLRIRTDENLLTAAATRMAERTFAQVWENQDDAIYDSTMSLATSFWCHSRLPTNLPPKSAPPL